MKNKLIILLFIIYNLSFNVLIASQDDESMVTIHAVDTNLPDLLAILAEESGFNIVTGPNVNASELLTTAPVIIDVAIFTFTYSPDGDLQTNPVCIDKLHYDENKQTIFIYNVYYVNFNFCFKKIIFSRKIL